jgi:hypothetical protein
MNWWLSLPLALTAGIVTWQSWRQASRNKFYTDTWWLFPFGIFVWGDGLILGPFWVGSALVFTVTPLLWVGRYLLLFYAFRAAYEVVYWINHQVAHRDYNPPLFRRLTWLGPNESAILYQLMNMCQVVIALALLLATWSWQ